MKWNASSQPKCRGAWRSEGHVNAAKEIVAELKSDAENWHGMEGSNLENSQKFSDVEECVSQLEDLKTELENISFNNVEFPGW
jgi:hypothetical protein